MSGHEAVLQNAAKNGQTQAHIFVYALGTKYDDVPIFDYLFPNPEMQAKLREFQIESVFFMVEKFFHPFVVTHKIYQIVHPVRAPSGDSLSDSGETGVKQDTKIKLVEVELSDDQINLFHDGNLAGDKYVGAIIVSWSKYC
jgi:hypothetical protein